MLRDSPRRCAPADAGRERKALRVYEASELGEGALLTVTGVAGLLEAPLVRVLVAGVAALREPEEAPSSAREHLDVRIRVAGLALEARMRTHEPELSEIVAERRAIRHSREREHARVHGLQLVAVVLDVALPAARGLVRLHVSMEAGLGLQLRCDSCVALTAGTRHLRNTLAMAALAAPALHELGHARVHGRERTRRRGLRLVQDDSENDQQREQREGVARLEELHGTSSPNDA